MNSMTGFGHGSASREGWEASVRASSVNRRSLEVSFSLTREWQPLEPQLANVVRERFSRGRIQLAVELKGSGHAGLQWDDAAVDSVLDRLRQAAERQRIPFQVTPELIFQIALAHPLPGGALTQDAALELVLEALEPALQELASTRAREGAVLAADLVERCGRLRNATEAIALQSEGTTPRYRENLLQRLRAAGLTEVDLDDERVLKEIALFAERIDLAEEVTRLRSHLDHLLALAGAEEAVGRKAEFVLQEMGREIHTIGSKANDIEIARLVIEFKNELERVREQIQNVE